MIAIDTIITPAGNLIVRSHNGGAFSLADVAVAVENFGPSGRFHGCPYLCILDRDISLPLETRRALTSFPATAWSAAAFVIYSKALRVMAPTMFKIIGLRLVRVFEDEALGVAWLDSVIPTLPAWSPKT